MERRYSRGLYLLNSFTWSRARDNASGHLEVQNGDNSRVNYRDLDGEFGTSGYDQPLNNTTSFVWELPFGKDRTFAHEPQPGARRGPRRLARRRHQHHDERRADQPVVLAGGGILGQRQPDVSAEPDGRSADAGDERTINNYLNRATVEIPDRSDAAVRQRAAQRARGSDRSTSSTWACTRRSASGGDQTRLEARVEAFNLLNKTNFGPANGNRSSSSFGSITSTSVARQIQLGLKFYF